MNSKNRYKPRRSAKKTPTRSRAQSNGFEFSALFRLGQLLVAAVLLYVTAALFTKGAGELGQDVSSYVLRYAGGGVLLILLHLFYGLLCSLLGRQVSRVCSQWLGTFSLYGAVCLFLGLLQKLDITSKIGLLSPGLLGQFFSGLLPRFIGTIGTMLLGLCLVFVSAFNYGHLSSARVAWLREKCSALHLPKLPRWRRKNDEFDENDLIVSDATEPEEQQNTPAPEVVYAVPPEEPQVIDEPETERTEDNEEAFAEQDPSGENDGAEEETPAPARKAGFFAAFASALREAFSNDDENDDEEAEVSREVEDFVSEERDDEDDESFSSEDEDAFEDRQNITTQEQDDKENSGEDEQTTEADDRFATRAFAPEYPLPTRRPSRVPEEGSKVNREQISTPLTKKPQVEIEPSGALDGTEETELPRGRVIAPGSFPPPLDLLGPHRDIREAVDDAQAQENGAAVIEALANFGVSAELRRTIIGPTVVQYQIQLAPGIKVSKVSALGNDIAVALGVSAIRVEAPIPGTSYIGIELPNVNRRAVPLRQILESDVFQTTKLKLPLPLGQTVDGRILISGLEELPHLLIAGTTGSGKSIFVNNCIVAMCYHNTPEQLRFIMVDPKRVEMGIYESLPHILAKPIVTPTAAVHALAWAVREMERRYDACSLAKVRSLASYNEKVLPKDRMPHIVIIVDELADLMMTAQKEVEEYIMRLAQMARAVGIHLMLATQRPSVNVLTGTIKANIPARVSFSLPSVADSRTIIDVSGAQNLLGKGDMLFVSTRTPHPMRIQSPFMDEQMNIRVVEYLRSTFGDPEYVDLDEQGEEPGGGKSSDFLEDSRLEEAIKIVLGTGVASSSGLQRQMRIGFTRAARMIDTMESMGIVGPQNGAKPREILVDEAEALEILDQHRG